MKICFENGLKSSKKQFHQTQVQLQYFYWILSIDISELLPLFCIFSLEFEKGSEIMSGPSRKSFLLELYVCIFLLPKSMTSL
jgi:hypothetical protein